MNKEEIEFEELYFGETVEVVIPFAPNRWQRFGGKIKVKEGQKMEELLDIATERIEAWHKQKYPEIYGIQVEKQGVPAYISNLPKNISPSEEDKAQEEWKHLVRTLTNLKYREDALEYLANSKEWRINLEAKQVAQSLTSKYLIK